MTGDVRGARSTPVDGFSLEYDVVGDGPAVVLLHGWPGDRSDYRRLVPLLRDEVRLITPDLRGFGGSDRLDRPPAQAYSAAAQLASVEGLLDELGVDRAVFVGYDIGSRLVQLLAAERPQRARALVLAPPLPGAGERLLDPTIQSEFWYQNLHRLDLPDTLLDSRPDAVRAYLSYLWSHWSAPEFSLPDAELDRIVALYSRPGAFRSSIAWYRSRRGSVATARGETPPAPGERVGLPTEVLWPDQDPLFPSTWSDRLEEWFSDLALTVLPGVGHFVPLEAPSALADAVRRALRRTASGPGAT